MRFSFVILLCIHFDDDDSYERNTVCKCPLWFSSFFCVLRQVNKVLPIVIEQRNYYSDTSIPVA